MKRPMFLLSLVLLSSCVEPEPPPVEGPPEKPLSSVVEDALVQLDEPCPRRLYGNYVGPSHRYRKLDFEIQSAERLEMLVKAKESLDGRLIRFALAGNCVEGRYRAAWVLANRGNAAVVPALQQMCASADAEERYLTWCLYAESVGLGKLPVPADVAWALLLRQQERDWEVRSAITNFLVAARVTAAVPALLSDLERRPSDHTALYALAAFGDRRALPAIIRAGKTVVREGGLQTDHLKALEAIGGAEATAYLVECKAREALEKKDRPSLPSPKGLPALNFRGYPNRSGMGKLTIQPDPAPRAGPGR